MVTREVAAARRELADVDREWQQATGVYQTRREHARARLARAEAEQKKMQEELTRLEYTSRAAFGVRTLYGTAYPEAGGRATFITQTSRADLRNRIQTLKARLSEA